jgi:hypothetical protein
LFVHGVNPPFEVGHLKLCDRSLNYRLRHDLGRQLQPSTDDLLRLDVVGDDPGGRLGDRGPVGFHDRRVLAGPVARGGALMAVIKGAGRINASTFLALIMSGICGYATST